MIVERGLVGISMESIADEAGISRRALYNRFGSKDAIVRAALESHWWTLSSKTAVELDSSRGVRAALTDAGADILAFARDERVNAMAHPPETEQHRALEMAREFYRTGRAQLVARLARYLEQATAGGGLNCRDPRLAARQFLGLLRESSDAGEDDSPQYDDASLIGAAIDVFLCAYGPLAAGGASATAGTRAG
jgi:AcrR family transcriptional regulator